MKCLTCGESMKCINDVCEESARIDFVECPKCNSAATICFDVKEGFITKVEWKRNK